MFRLGLLRGKGEEWRKMIGIFLEVFLVMLSCFFFCLYRCRRGVVCRVGFVSFVGEDVFVFVMGCGISKVFFESFKDV